MPSPNDLPPPRPPPDETSNGNGSSASDVVRNEILACGISRGELSRRTGVNAATISRFMNKRSTITLMTFELLALELGFWVATAKLRVP